MLRCFLKTPYNVRIILKENNLLFTGLQKKYCSVKIPITMQAVEICTQNKTQKCRIAQSSINECNS